MVSPKEKGNSNMSGSKRKIHIDILRIFAALLVIFNHTSGFYYYHTYVNIWESGIFVVLSVITKIAVSIFFMISGALLLGKEESYTVLFTKRILQFFMLEIP